MFPDRATREKSRRTRDSILAAAERLFAQKGFEGASMRDITSAANVNLSVAYYYFEDKEDLLLAVIEKCIFPVMEKQRELLAKARAEAGETGVISARRLVESLVLPRMAQVSEPAHQLMSLLFVRRSALAPKILSALKKLTGEIQIAFLEEFRKTFPAISEAELNFRMANMEALLTGWKAFAPYWKGECSGKIPKSTYFEMFITLLAQMFSAPAFLPPPRKA